MNVEQRCPVTELLVAQCDHCRVIATCDDPFAAPTVVSYGTDPFAFRARYYGTCTTCGYEIESDMYIRSDGEGGYVHEDCFD